MFGCLAYVHVNDEKRRNLDEKYEDCVFIRYCEYSKAYKFYNPKTHKTICSRDVSFDEGEEYGNKKLQQKVFVEESFEKKTSSNIHTNHVMPHKSKF